MTKNLCPAIYSLLEPLGDWENNIPPGAVFATFLPKEKFDEIEDLAHLPYPPISPKNSGCIFDPEDRTVRAMVWGRATVSPNGLRIKPAWRMSRDKMLLRVEVTHKDFEGKTVTLEHMRSHLPKVLETIEKRLDFAPVNEALEQSAAEGDSVTVTVAEGTFPGEGQDARLELTFNAGSAAGTLREDGSMDFRERANLHAANEGDELGRLYPARVGEFGYDLFDNPIHPPEVQKGTTKAGQGVITTTDEDGVSIYTAAQAGVARFMNDMIEVIDLLEIPGDVDYGTGNVRSEQGTIHIKGDVKSGFVVECTGDVIIDGVVEEADIIAGGLVIAGGVIMNGDNSIKAEGDVSAHFFRNAVIEAGGDVTADQELALCDVKAVGKVTVIGERGVISGGHIVSGDDIQASIIGNKACMKTHVEIRMPSTVDDKIQVARKEFKAELAHLDKAIGVDFELSSLMNAPDEDRRILAELIKVRSRLQTELRTLEESSARLLEEAQKEMETKRITANKKTYCSTEVTICGKSHTVKKDMESTSFYLDVKEQQIAWS